MSATRVFQCYDCQHRWTLPYGAGRPEACPACHGGNFCRVEGERQGAGVLGLGGPNRRCRCGQKQR